MYFDAVVVFVTSQTLLFRLALAILCVLSRAVSRSDQGFFAIVTHQYLLLFQGSLKTKGLIGEGLIFASHFLMNFQSFDLFDFVIFHILFYEVNLVCSRLEVFLLSKFGF